MCPIYNQLSQKYVHWYNKFPVYQREMLLRTVQMLDLGSILQGDDTSYNQTLLFFQKKRFIFNI